MIGQTAHTWNYFISVLYSTNYIREYSFISHQKCNVVQKISFSFSPCKLGFCLLEEKRNSCYEDDEMQTS